MQHITSKNSRPPSSPIWKSEVVQHGALLALVGTGLYGFELFIAHRRAAQSSISVQNAPTAITQSVGEPPLATVRGPQHGFSIQNGRITPWVYPGSGKAVPLTTELYGDGAASTKHLMISLSDEFLARNFATNESRYVSIALQTDNFGTLLHSSKRRELVDLNSRPIAVSLKDFGNSIDHSRSFEVAGTFDDQGNIYLTIAQSSR